MRPRFFRLFTLAFVLSPLAAGAEPVVFHADWFPGAQFAGIYAAEARGFYRDAGIELTWKPFAFGLDTPAAMDAAPDTAAIGAIEGYIFVQKRARGLDLRLFAAMLRESPAGYMVTAGSGIHSLADFPGRRIGVHKFADPIYRWLMTHAGLDPASADMRFVGDDVTLLTRGELDAMQGYATEEFLRLQKLTGGTSRFLAFSDLGFSSYSEVLYTTAGQLTAHAPVLHRFVDATRLGWLWVFAHPREAATLVASHLDTSPDVASLEATLAALRNYVAPAGSAPLAPMSPEKWLRIEQACVDMKLIPATESPAAFLIPAGAD